MNLGPVVNSALGESRVALSHDATTLYVINHLNDPLRSDISVSTRTRITGRD